MARAIALSAFVLVGCARVVAAQEPLAQWFDLPVPGGRTTLEAFGISADERAFTLSILTRALNDRESRVGLTPPRAAALLASIEEPAAGDSDADRISVPAPLDARTWWQLLPAPNQGDLFSRLLTDRNALLVATALMSTDDSVRALLARDRDLLRFIYRNAAGSFSIAARRLKIVDGAVVVPGGSHGEVVWRSLVGEPPARVGPFLRALLTKDSGRLAWYFDTIGGLDAAHLAAAWREPSIRDDAAFLYATFRDTDPQWRAQDQPFRRALADAWVVTTLVDVDNGFVTSPLSRDAWALLFASSPPTAEQLERVLRDGSSRVPLPWMVEEIVSAPARERRQRFEMVRLAQRVSVDLEGANLATFAAALSGIRDCRALMFALERMQIRNASTWAAAVAAARHVSNAADDRRESLAAFQSAVALIERMRHVRTIDVAGADRLIRTLSATVQIDKRVTRSLSRWIVDTLTRTVPPLVRPDAFTGETAYESTIIQALAGPPNAARLTGDAHQSTTRLQWEGLTYVVDVAAAEHDRMRAMRALMPSLGLDDAIASGRPRELADALMTLVYATALGDPDGPASLSPDVATRHDFGLASTSILREELPWAPPEERQGFGPWRVSGSLLGLDLGLSRLALRRVADDQMPRAPTLTLNDLGTLTRTSVALVAADLTDGERDEIAAAIARGRARVQEAVGAGTPALEALALELRMSSTTWQLFPWMVARQRDAIVEVFSLRDLMWLGRPGLTRAQLDRWGVAADGLDGRRITAMPQPAPWEDYAGRPEAGQVSTQTPDLTLRLVEETARLRLPATLIPSLLGFALQDYWHDVQARFADDWPQLTRQAARLSSARIQDYVAALTGNGPLRAQ
jgi:hypothetical protein